jgi:hypothetical protein
MAERLERYEVRVVEAWREQHPKARHSPLVVSAVLYHGPRRWNAPRRYERLIDLPLEQLVAWGDWVRHPEYRLELLKQRSEEELLGRQGPPMAKLGLMLMQHSGRPTLLNRRLPEWSPLWKQVYATPHGQGDLEASVRYVRNIGNKATDEVMRRVLDSLVSKRRAEEIMGLAERVVSKEALQEAEAKGEAKGRAEYVLRTLIMRGIHLTPSAQKRILACKDPAQLDRWFDRALSAHSLKEVLGDPARRHPRRRSTSQAA